MINLDDYSHCQDSCEIRHCIHYMSLQAYIPTTETITFYSKELALLILQSKQRLFNYKGYIYHLQDCYEGGKITFEKVRIVE